MKERNYPLHEACEYFSYCTSEKGGNRKDCGHCSLHPRADRIFTPTFVLQLFLQVFICFIAGAVCVLLKMGG